MGNRPASYWILVALALAALVGSRMMRSSLDPHNQQMAQYLGYGAIALMAIAILFFRRKADPTPPMPKD
jgi:hypothetical protein